LYGKEKNMANKKYIDINNLQRLNELLNTKNTVDILINAKTYANESVSFKSTHCPNCGAIITGSKCPYCDTDFKQSLIWGKELLC
jgi:hypothetical protein